MQCALLLHCINAKVNGLGGPFGICELRCKPDILCLTLVAECDSLVSARDIITAEMLKLENATIAIFTPACARFPAFDGFIAYHGNGPVRVFGYQCKLNRAHPKHDAGRRKLFYCAAMLPLMVIRGEVGSIAAMSSSKHRFWVTRLRPLYPVARKVVAPMDEDGC